MAFLARLFRLILGAFERKNVEVPVEVPENVPVEPEPPTRRERLYTFSKAAIGRRMGLNKAVPQLLNCANACSHLLIEFGVEGLPKLGIEGTLALDSWLRKSPEFELVDSPLPGDIASFPSGTGNGKLKNGHIFVVGFKDWMSNNSATGKWEAHWTRERALDYYERYGGFKTAYFRIKD